MDRRQFLDLGCKASTSLLLGAAVKIPTSFGLFAQTPSSGNGKLTVSSRNITSGKNIFQVQKTKWEIARHQPTSIWGFLPNSFAPPLVIDQDDFLDLTLYNRLASETLGLHWHGVRVPNAMDGVPNLTQAPIALGKKYHYRFASSDAGTFWYHTHSHSMMQMRMGLVGPLIIREKTPYPVDEDLILLMNDWNLDSSMNMDRGLVKNQFKSRHTMAHDGLLGNVITINGKVNPPLEVAPNSRLRLRFINAATARIFYVNLPPEVHPHFLAIDGHPVPMEAYQKIALAPGMRMDIVVDIPDNKVKSFQVTDNAYRQQENLFRLIKKGKALTKKTLSRPQLPPNPIPTLKPNQAQVFRVGLNGGAMSGMMNMGRGMMSGLFWDINGKAMAEDEDYRRPIFQVKQGRHVILKLENTTAFAHPIHLHGHTFSILSRDGVKARNPRLTDMIFLNPQEKAEIGFVADNPGKWMLHCHIIDHQVSGMMGFFEVG